MISIKIWETPLSLLTKCSFPVAVPVSKTRVLKLPFSDCVTRSVRESHKVNRNDKSRLKIHLGFKQIRAIDLF